MPTITELVESLSGKGPQVKVRNTQQVNIRLDTQTYASLVALSRLFGESAAGFSRMLLEAAIPEAVEALEGEHQGAYEATLEQVLENLQIQEDEQ